MRKGNKLIQEGKVPKKRTLNTQVLTDIVNGYYLDGIEAGYKAGYDYGYEEGYRQHGKDFVSDGEKAYQQGLEDGRKQGVSIDRDKRYWDGYHTAQEDGKKIYQKGYEDGARCQDEVQYQKGLDDAWAAARKLTHPRYGGYRDDEMKKIFGFIESDLILMKMSASEAVEKIRAYEEKQKQEGRSGYVSFVGDKQQEQGVKTVFPDNPCDLCRFNPPGSGDGKPCTMCPAEGRSE
jgi:hypothetical protein